MSLVTGITQVCAVVRDCDAVIRQLHDIAGVGPWAVWDFEAPVLTNTKVRGIETPFSMRLALAWTKEGFCWEVIQPLTGPSIYQEFLDAHGEGLHHVLVNCEGKTYEETIAEFTQRGCPPAMEGNLSGADFAYFETEGPLKFTLEISNKKSGFRLPAPKYWYPYALEEFPAIYRPD